MAVIQGEITIKDGVTPAFRKMAAAVENLERVLSSVDSRFRNAFDAKSIKAVENELAQCVQLTNLQRTSIEKLNNKIEQSEKKRIALEEESKSYGNILLVQSKARADLNAKINSITKQQAEQEAIIAERKHKLIGLEKAIASAKKDGETSAYKIESMELLRNKWLSANERGQARIKEQQREVLNLTVKLCDVEHMVEDAHKRKAEITDQINYALADEAHWTEQIAEINRKAISDQAKLASQQANRVQQALDGVEKEKVAFNNLMDVSYYKLQQEEKVKEAAANKQLQQQEQLKQKSEQILRVERAIGMVETFHADEVAKVTQEYEESLAMVSKLESTINRGSKAERAQLAAVKQTCNARQQIMNLTNQLVGVRSKLTVLEMEGKNKTLEAANARRQEKSIVSQIEKHAKNILNLERQTLPAINANTEAKKRFNETVEDSESEVDSLWSKIKGIGGAYIGVQGVKSVIETADSLAANDARLALMVKEGETVQQLSDNLYAAAMRSRTGYLDMADAVAKVGIQAGNLFDNSAQMVRFMETFSKMGVISKATTQQINSARTQLIQALSFGQLRGDELKSILENMPMVAHALADELTRMGGFGDLPKKLKYIAKDGKVTADEIRALGYEGEISADTVVRAMLNGGEKMDEMAKNMTWTWAQVWEVFSNSALRAFTPVFNGISKIISTERFQRFATWVDKVVGKLAKTINSLWITLGPVAAAIFDTVAKMGDFIGDNLSVVAPIVMGIVGAMVAWRAITIAGAACLAIHNGIVAAKNLLTAIATGGTFAQTAAQYGLNTALLACPITWIILAIVAFIAVVYIAVALINKFAGTSISATGIICGVFTALGVHIWNVIAYMWNTIASFVEFFVNVWSNPMYSVKKLFVNLTVNVIDSLIAMTKGCDKFATKFVNAIFWAVNKVIDYWNKFIDILPDDLKSRLSFLGKGTHIKATTSFTSDLESFKNDLNSLVADKPEGYWEAPRMQQKDVLGTAKKAYDWGDKTSAKIEGAIKSGDLSKVVGKYAGDFSKALAGGFDGSSEDDPLLKSINKNTADTAKNTKKDDDNFKYMRQLAERDSMNRSQLMNFKVDMSNVNHIKSGLDVDEVMKRLAKELYNELVSKMEGVY